MSNQNDLIIYIDGEPVACNTSIEFPKNVIEGDRFEYVSSVLGPPIQATLSGVIPYKGIYRIPRKLKKIIKNELGATHGIPVKKIRLTI